MLGEHVTNRSFAKTYSSGTYCGLLLQYYIVWLNVLLLNIFCILEQVLNSHMPMCSSPVLYYAISKAVHARRRGMLSTSPHWCCYRNDKDSDTCCGQIGSYLSPFCRFLHMPRGPSMDARCSLNTLSCNQQINNPVCLDQKYLPLYLKEKLYCNV